MSDDLEKEIALYEAERNRAWHSWFAARGDVSPSDEHTRIFDGGFRMAWELCRAQPAPQLAEQQPLKSSLALDAATHLTNWLDMDWCECEGGHACGYNEVKRTRDALLVAAEQQQAAPDVAGLVEALEGILPYVVDEPWECRGDKCRELWCISCYGDEEACESAAKAKQAIHKAVSALAAHRKQRDES